MNMVDLSMVSNGTVPGLAQLYLMIQCTSLLVGWVQLENISVLLAIELVVGAVLLLLMVSKEGGRASKLESKVCDSQWPHTCKNEESKYKMM